MSTLQIERELENKWFKSSNRIMRAPAGFLFGWGTTVGNGLTDNWAPGALFIDTNAAAGQQQWVNKGDATTANWQRDSDLLDGGTLIFGTGDDQTLAYQGTADYLAASAASGVFSNTPPSGLMANKAAKYCEYFDDFYSADHHTYVETTGGAGANAFQDAANGIYNVVTAATDNDHHAMSSVNQSWLFASGKKLWFEARFKLAEATTNESAWWFGFTDTLTTGGLQANAAGPLTSYDGALIWKDEGTMAIDFETSNATTQATTTNMATFVTNTWTTVGFYFDGTATTSVITPYVDNTAGTAQNITLAGLEEMDLVFGVKAGPTAAAETLQVDYVHVIQLR
jgi:hypothetical protein